MNNVPNNFVVAGIVSANDSPQLSTRDILNTVKILEPTIFGGDELAEENIMENFKMILSLFSNPDPNINWNFLSESRVINLQPGVTKYPVPDNFTKMISVYLDINSRLNTTGKIEVGYRSLERTDFEDDDNFYYKEGNNFIFSNLRLLKKLPLCQSCGQCDTCNMLTGNVNIHYFTMPRPPDNLDEKIEWLPRHPAIKYYLALRLAQQLSIMVGGVPIQPRQQEIDRYYNILLSYDKNLYPVQNKSNNDSKKINFNKLNNKFRV